MAIDQRLTAVEGKIKEVTGLLLTLGEFAEESRKIANQANKAAGAAHGRLDRTAWKKHG